MTVARLRGEVAPLPADAPELSTFQVLGDNGVAEPTRVPRIAAIQAEGASPFAQSFRDAFAKRHKVKAETVATAIRIGDPASFDRGVNAIRFTDGVGNRRGDSGREGSRGCRWRGL